MNSRIVVGVDGSDGSRRALRWALDEAAIRCTLLQAVNVWQIPVNFEEVKILGGNDDWAGAASNELAGAVTAVLVEADAGVRVDRVVLEGDPATVLCTLSADADLLVVGARRHARFAALVPGSVSTRCIHHGRCPVVVVP